MRMKMKAEVVCRYESLRVSKTVAKALEPDNLKLPEGLVVSTRAKGKRVASTVELDGRMETILATLDDLLACTLTAETLL
ncbi:MAG: KEOPS complex subunit Pcc1 [Methanobacteriota archaeon]